MAIGTWTLEEDEQLRKAVAEYGAKNWNGISKYVPERSGKSCRLRWRNHLSPDVEHRPFTDEEDKIIAAAHAKFGNKWARIARLLIRRTDNDVRNRWHVGLKRQRYGDEEGDGGFVVLMTDPKKRRAVSSESRMGVDVSGASTVLSMVPYAQIVKPRPVEMGSSSKDPSTSLTLALPGANLRQESNFSGGGGFSAEFMAVVQKMIKSEVRSYMAEMQKNKGGAAE